MTSESLPIKNSIEQDKALTDKNLNPNKPLDKESIWNIFRVVLGVSLFCSILVSASAVILRDIQNSNQSLDRKKNVLVAAGIYRNGMTKTEILDKFSLIQPIAIDFQTGGITENIDPAVYDMSKSAKDPNSSLIIPADKDIANIRRISQYGILYLYQQGGNLEKIILPIQGPGLWSTLYGFLSLEKDAKTVSGINFYDHKETPGLGGEIDNPRWQSGWIGKSLFGDNGIAIIEVIKGTVDNSREGSETKVDGISGATITARAVGDTVRFWVGDFAYGKVLNNKALMDNLVIKIQENTPPTSNNNESRIGDSEPEDKGDGK